MLKIIELPVTPFRQICRIVFDANTRGAVLVDPGGDAEEIMNRLRIEKLDCKEVWLTHSHLDHCGGVKALKKKLCFRLCAHPNEREMRRNVVNYAAMFALPNNDMDDCPEPDLGLQGGETLYVVDHGFEVLFTPGHSPGHLCFYSQDKQILLSGDLIFSGAIGRSDLPGGNHEVLMSSIRHTILTLPDETRILSGHGASTTVGEERCTNPFLVNLKNNKP